MPFFQNAQHVNIHGCTFSETHGDQNIYNGSVYNLDSYNSMSTETRGSYNDSSTNLRGTKRYNGDKLFNPTSPARKGGAQDRHMKHASTAFGAQHSQNAALPSTTQWKQTHHKSPSSRSTSTYPNIAEARRLRAIAAEMRRVHLEDAPRRGDFGAPREVDQDFSDEGSDAGMSDDAGAEIFEDDQRFSSSTPSTSTTTPFTSPSLVFNSSSSSPAGSEPRASRNSQPRHTNPFAQMTQTQQDRNTHQAMYYGGVWNNSSNNNTSNATHDSHNDSSITIIESD